jgi:hypothetical protein
VYEARVQRGHVNVDEDKVSDGKAVNLMGQRVPLAPVTTLHWLDA